MPVSRNQTWRYFARFARLGLIGLGVFVGYVLILIVAFNTLIQENPRPYHVDPLSQKLAPRPNQYLVAPDEMAVAAANRSAPVYEIGAEKLARIFEKVALAHPRVRRVAGGPCQFWATFVQRSPVLQFPDYISVRVVPVDERRSTLAIYSRAAYGYSDLGANKGRIDAWLEELDARLTAPGG